MDTLVLNPNVLRDSILVRLEMLHFEAYIHVNAIMWRLVYRELRALTNDSKMGLNPMELNDIYDHLWNVGVLLKSDEALHILEEGWRPWPRVKDGKEVSWDFYDIHDRHKAADLNLLRAYGTREDVHQYTTVLKEVLNLFGDGIRESITRTMGAYLESTGGRLRNSLKTEWEKDIASRMICTNNPAEGPFATVRAFLHMYPTLKLKTIATQSAAIVNGTHKMASRKGDKDIAAGMALSADPKLKEAISKLCSIRIRNPGLITIYVRDNDVKDTVAATIHREKKKQEKKNESALKQAKKIENHNVAMETKLSLSHVELKGEIDSFGSVVKHKLSYLQEQFRSRKLLRKGIYNSIPTPSKFRSEKKPYPLRMNPHPDPIQKIKDIHRITYLQQLLRLMITEDNLRALEPTVRLEDTKLVRQLPVVSETFLNPLSVRLKTEQEVLIAAMASTSDNPWLTTLQDAYLGKLLYDGGYYRVIAIQYVPNKNSNRYPCWEATTEPVYKDKGAFVVHDRHLSFGEDGSRTVLKSSLIGFALAEYSNGDNVDPVPLTFADECIAKAVRLQARTAATSARPAATSARKRRRPASPRTLPTRTNRSSRTSSTEFSTTDPVLQH